MEGSAFPVPLPYVSAARNLGLEGSQLIPPDEADLL